MGCSLKGTKKKWWTSLCRNTSVSPKPAGEEPKLLLSAEESDLLGNWITSSPFSIVTPQRVKPSVDKCQNTLSCPHRQYVNPYTFTKKHHLNSKYMQLWSTNSLCCLSVKVVASHCSDMGMSVALRAGHTGEHRGKREGFKAKYKL